MMSLATTSGLNWAVTRQAGLAAGKTWRDVHESAHCGAHGTSRMQEDEGQDFDVDEAERRANERLQEGDGEGGSLWCPCLHN
jgi:hypothetical protein